MRARTDNSNVARLTLAQALAGANSTVALWSVRLPPPSAAGVSAGRPLSVITRQPAFVGAALCGAVSYAQMNCLMTAAPLAMRLWGRLHENANLGLRWHVIAMYGPSFVIGRLITRIGSLRVVLAGLLLTGLAALTGLSRHSQPTAAAAAIR